ncbi:hypothetical protein [Vibrio viridaestus]|uniref:Gp5/Type VI secretion system Vgr protein OB-fold domain-containing protein n=1 Tax=Vibrio viridaestus TaxID=2487322 RepID=A0A3N9TJD9_9VIBR|nr:hypothetical protein [Vibrio viridaestus]RQW64044.1 hypothetical protein EES38_05415 [Vibrio viridaestus]
MKLTKRLYISNEEVHLSSAMLSLKLSLGGKAIFVIEANEEPQRLDLVRLDIGYEPDLYIYFEGYIDKVQPAQNGFYKITVKENSGILSQSWPISIEHPTAIEILNQLETLTGLEFYYPDKAYMQTAIPNFVHHGNGYQCLDKLAKAFQINDAIWFQADDQRVFIGAFEDSMFYQKPMTIADEFTSRQTANSVSFVPFPMLRPGRELNGHRITRVDLINEEMTAYWKPTSSETEAKKQEIYRYFPELTAGYHLPMFGRVEAVRDCASVGDKNEPFRPRYAVDVQILNENLEPNTSIPVYRSIPLPVNVSGHEAGNMAYPLEGTMVEIAFAYGRSDRPVIRGIYGREYPLPSIEPGELLQQQREEVSHRIDAAGNITEQTDQTHTLKSFKRSDEAYQYQGSFGSHQLDIMEHSIENIVGKKLIEALGAIELLAGDNIELGSLGNMHIATAGEMIEVIGKHRRSITGDFQWLQAPETWLGSYQENVLILLSELMRVVKELSDTLAAHTHTSPETGALTSAPNQSGTITGHGEDSWSLKERLDPITKT